MFDQISVQPAARSTINLDAAAGSAEIWSNITDFKKLKTDLGLQRKKLTNLATLLNGNRNTAQQLGDDLLYSEIYLSSFE